MGKAVFKDVLDDDARPLRNTGEGHELGLQVRGKAGEGLCGDLEGAQRPGAQEDRLALRLHFAARLPQFVQHGAEVAGNDALQKHFSMRDGRRGKQRTGDDAVRKRPVARPAEALYALDGDAVRAAAAHLAAQRVDKILQIAYLRLAGGVMYGGPPPRQHCGHHHVFRGPDAGKVQIDVRAAQARALALDHAVRLAYLHAQRPQTL